MILVHSQWKEELHQIIELVEQRAFHSYVQRFVDYPNVDLYSLHFTYLFLTMMSCSSQVRESICVSQLFIQLGLDSHDQVSLEALKTDDQIKNRQLTILSGDYFSSYYYFYLAQRNEIELVHKWARIIEEINILKTNLHSNWNKWTKEKSFDQGLVIKGRLPHAVLSWFNADNDWFLMHRLFTRLIHGSNMNELNENEIEQLIGQLNDLIKAQNNHLISSELQLWLDLFITEKQLAIEP